MATAELVESGTAGVTDPMELGRSFAQLRRLMSKNKSKKVVDTRASKGRKLRFDVQTSLVGYMPPTHHLGQTPNAMAQELFSHLFSSA